MLIHKLEKDFIWNCGRKFLENIEFYDKKGKLWLEIKNNGDIIVKKDYSWDGCTPKFNILDLFIIGTPDGVINIRTGKPKTYYASLIHDALYQFIDDERMLFNRKDIDDFFYSILKEEKFILAPIYYIIVRITAGFWRKFIAPFY